MKGMNIILNNAKKLIIAILFLLITIIFQSIVIVRLNIVDRELDYKIKQEKILNINKHNTAITDEQTNVQESDTTYNKDYTNIDVILSDENLKKYFSNTLFIGDSRTEGLKKFTPVSKYAYFCCNVGNNVNKLITDSFFINNENITLYDTISKEKYKKIILCMGYNELGWKYEDTFIEKYMGIISKIKEISPDSDITIISILHISKDASVSNEYENNERIDLYNSKIKIMCETMSCNYLDLNQKFTDSDGYLLSEGTTDGIHFTNEYYNKYLYEISCNLKE